MKNDLKTWRALASKRVPMVAAILYACSYYEQDDPEWWKLADAQPGKAPTFCVNPVTLEVNYSTKFTSANTVDQNAFVLAHEGGHVLCDHLGRRVKMMKREGSQFIAPLWIMAEEEAVNWLIQSTGGWAKIPIKGVEPQANHKGLTTEEIYFDLKKNCKVVKVPCNCIDKAAMAGDGKDGSSINDILKAKAIETGRKVAIEGAKGQQPGDQPGELRELSASFRKLDKPPDFREVLLRYMTSMAISASHFDEATIYRNRVLLDGLCIPNLGNKPQASKFVVSIDNSGSVHYQMFELLKSCLVEGAEQLGFNEIIVQHFTTKVMATERYTDLTKLKGFKRRADGGTALDDCDHKALKAGGVFHIILTDGYVSWLPSYSLPTVIVRPKSDVQPPMKVRNLVADMVLPS